MKRIFIIFLLLSVLIIAKAQRTSHTLQFSRVLLITNTNSLPAVVPAAANNGGIDCVWKIESVLSPEVRYPTSGNSLPSNSRMIMVNGNSIAVHEEFFNAVGFEPNSDGSGAWMSSTESYYNNPVAVQVSKDNTKLPIWLPAGTSLAVSNNVTAISVVEFIVN